MDKPLAGRRILVVEDEMMVLMMIEDTLADLGCESVTSAATIDQALAFIKKQTFDAATLDVNLNGRESYPVAEALHLRGVPFAFSTGYSDHNLREQHRDRPVLKKPYRPSDLAQLLALLLAEPRPLAPAAA